MMIMTLIFILCVGIICGMVADRLMHQQWYAKDSYYQKKMIDRAKVYKNISTLFLVGGAILCMYLLFFKL